MCFTRKKDLIVERQSGSRQTYVSSFYLSTGVLSLCLIGRRNRICSHLGSSQLPSFCVGFVGGTLTTISEIVSGFIFSGS